MKRLLLLLPLAVLFIVSARTQSQGRPFPAVTDAMLQNPDPADWLMWRRTLNSWGYSPLNQINRANVGKPAAWSGRRGMGPGIQEATPLVHDGVMYLPNPSDYIQAIDAATGDLKWEYKRKLPDDLGKFIPGAQHQPQHLAIYGDQHHRHQRRRFRVRARRRRPASWRGKPASSTIARTPAQETAGPHHRQRQDFLRRADANSSSARTAASSRRTTPRPARNCGAPARSPSPASRATKPGAAFPYAKRRHVGAWMVPSYDRRAEPAVRRHVRDLARAQVPARRQRQDSTSITTRRWR